VATDARRAAAPPPGGAPPAIAPEELDPRSTTEVLTSLVANVQALVKKEIELAKLEITDIVTARLDGRRDVPRCRGPRAVHPRVRRGDRREGAGAGAARVGGVADRDRHLHAARRASWRSSASARCSPRPTCRSGRSRTTRRPWSGRSGGSSCERRRRRRADQASGRGRRREGAARVRGGQGRPRGEAPRGRGPPAEDADQAAEQVRDIRARLDQDLDALEARIPPRDTLVAQAKTIGGAAVAGVAVVAALTAWMRSAARRRSSRRRPSAPLARSPATCPTRGPRSSVAASSRAIEEHLDEDGGLGTGRKLTIVALLVAAAVAIWSQLQGRDEPDVWGPPPA
jgi:hypothetical protein